MKKFLSVLISLPIFATCDALGDDVNSLFDKHMQPFNRINAPGCAVVLTNQGNIIKAEAYGIANLDYNIPLTTKSVFRIASVSKQFTAMSIRLLIEDGKVDDTLDIHEYLPELPNYDAKITVRHLMEHTSGLPNYDHVGYPVEAVPDYVLDIDGKETGYWMPIFMSDNQFWERILKVDSLQFEPGSKSAYNNVGYYLLGKIVERVSGKHLRDFAKDRIFDPLGMSNTFFNTETFRPVKNRAVPYYRLKDGTFIEYQTDINWIGDGGIFTTVEDLAKWDGNFYNNQLGGGAELIRDMVTPNSTLNTESNTGPALGLFVQSTDFGTVVEHGGAWLGFQTHSERHLPSGYGVYMLCNTYEASGNLPEIPRKMLQEAIENKF